MKKGNLFLLAILVILSCKGKVDHSSGSEGELHSVHPKVGVALYSFNRFAFSETLEKSKQAGSEIIEGFFFHKLGGDYGEKGMAELTGPELTELKRTMQEKGLSMPSMYAGGKTEEDWASLFGVGEALGMDFLTGEPEPELWDVIDKMAGARGMKLAIHEHAQGKSRYWHPDSVLAAIEGHENFGACGDLGHWVRSGLDPVSCLKKLEGHLISIHAKDLNTFGDIEADDVKVGTGVIDYKGVIAELSRQGFKGPIYVECEHDWEDNLEDVKYAVDYIRERFEEP